MIIDLEIMSKLIDQAYEKKVVRENNKPPSRKERKQKLESRNKLFYSAFRNAVYSQCRTYKETEFAAKRYYSALSGEQLDWNNCHADHNNPSFKTLVDDYLLTYNLKLLDVPILKVYMPSWKVWRYIINKNDIRDKWKSYHKTHAKLQLLSKDENLRKKKK